ncbi:hypothetical protein ACU8KI_16150 [Rhizobium leguminosarum]
MADENDTATDADVPAPAAPEAVKKQRKPRVKEAAVDAGSVEVATDSASGCRQRRWKAKEGANGQDGRRR